MKKLFLISILISLISPIKTSAGFPEGEKGYNLKKIEESFKLPCIEQKGWEEFLNTYVLSNSLLSSLPLNQKIRLT